MWINSTAYSLLLPQVCCHRRERLSPPFTAPTKRDRALIRFSRPSLSARAIPTWRTICGDLRELGELKAAHNAFEQALAIDEAALGSDHPSVGRDVNNLAGLLRDMRDILSVQETLDWGLSIHANALGSDHPTTQAVARNGTSLGS